MTHSNDIQLELEDLLANMRFARKHNELGRLALLAYCEVKGWARRAGKPDVADKALQMFSQCPHLTKQEFIEDINSLIARLALHEQEYQRTNARYALNVSAAPLAMG